MLGAADSERRGVLYAVAAYVLWGSFPLYFRLLEPARPVEILGHRIFWSLVALVALLALTVGFRPLRRLLADRRRLGLLALAAFFIALNWGVFIYGANSDQVVQVALGYFIGPLVSVVLGVFVFRERLRPWQLAALGVAACAVVVLTVDYARVPWISLTLAVSFACYGMVRKIAGVASAEGLAVETLILVTPALGYLVALELQGDASFGHASTADTLLLAASGPVTAIPLLLFGGAVTRVPLSLIGLLQYITPSLQFLVGVLVVGEAMPAARWIGFALVWIALVILSLDGLRAAGRARSDAAAAEPAIA